MFAITSTALVTQMILSSVVTKIMLFGQGAVKAMRRLGTGGSQRLSAFPNRRTRSFRPIRQAAGCSAEMRPLRRSDCGTRKNKGNACSLAAPQRWMNRFANVLSSGGKTAQCPYRPACSFATRVYLFHRCCGNAFWMFFAPHTSKKLFSYGHPALPYREALET